MSRRTTARTTVAALVAVLWVMLAAGVAEAQDDEGPDDDGLLVVADKTYRVLPDEGVIEVEVVYELTNQVPNYSRGYTTYQTYFQAFVELIPETATDIVAVRSSGREVSMEILPPPDDAEVDTDDPFIAWEIDLGPNLFYRQTRNITLTYRLPDGPPRSFDSWARVNPAFIRFPVFVNGDSGHGSVRVDVPAGFDVDIYGDDLDPHLDDDDEWDSWTATDVDDTWQYLAQVVGRSDEGLVREPVPTETGGEFRLAAWPGDAEWSAMVIEGVAEGVAILEEQIGLAWPHEGLLEVVETPAPSLAGYAGVYYEPSGNPDLVAVIEIGEELEPRVLQHELAHAWFNRDFSPMRWLNEGLAEYFAQTTGDELDAEGDRFSTALQSNSVAFDLLDWRQSEFVFDEDDRERELFAYSASYQLFRSLAAEIGTDGMRAAIAVLWTQQNPYDTTLEDPGPSFVSWEDALDAFEIVGGSETVEDLFVTWVLSESKEDALEPRRDAREELAAFEESDPRWTTPLIVAERMADWDFETATDLIERMTEIIDDADALAERADAAAVTLPADPQDAYEAVVEADDAFEETVDLLAAQDEALTALESVHDRASLPRGFFARLGLRNEDIDADLATMDQAFEDGEFDDADSSGTAIVALLDDAEGEGKQFALIVGGSTFAGLVAISLLLWWFVRRRRRRRRSGDEPAEDTEAPEDADPAEDPDADADEDEDEDEDTDPDESDEGADPG